MVTTKLNLSMTEPQVRQIYAKQGDTGRVLDITLDQTPEDGTLRILRPDGTEVTSEAVTGGEVSESGETVTFESMTEADVTELTVGIEPVQDLNGYDAPWVGGAGKNILPVTMTSGTTSSGIVQNVDSFGVITLTGTVGSSVYLGVVDTITLPSGTYVINGMASNNYSATLQVRNGSASGGTIATDSGNGALVSLGSETTLAVVIRIPGGTTIPNSLVVKPMLRLSTETDPTWQPYSNICPITGHDEVTVTDEGKNRALFANESNQDRASFTYESETANKIVATATTTAKFIGRYEAFLVKGVSYKALYTNKGASVAPYIYRDRLWGSLVRTVFSGEVFTVDTTQTYVIGIYAPAQSTYDVEDFMVIEASETDTSWTPYQSNTYTTSLGQTVYGGTLDLVSGVLTVDKAMVDLGSLTWAYTSNVSWFYSWTDASNRKPYAPDDVADAISSNYAVYSRNDLISSTTIVGFCIDNSGNVVVRDTRYTDATAFKTAMSGVQLCYELATPQTYTLTAQQIKTLVGTNNVWASSGDIVSITFTYGGLLSELPSEATEIVGKCYCDVEQNGVSSMPFTLNVKKNERQ